MTYFKPTSTILTILVALVLLAGLVSADNPAKAPSVQLGPNAKAPNPNVESLVNTSPFLQIKGGASTTDAMLSVGAFTASTNAGFNRVTYINEPSTRAKGMLNGAPQQSDVKKSILSFGDALADITLAIEGSAYTQNGGFYSTKIVTPAGTLKPLCATQGGDIILCADVPPVQQPPQEHKTVGGYTQIENFFSPDSNIWWRKNEPSTIVSLDTQTVAINTLPGFVPTVHTGHQYPDGPQQSANSRGLMDDSIRIWNVQETAKYDISIDLKGELATYQDEASQQSVQVNFFLKVNDTVIPLTPPKSGGCTTAVFPGPQYPDTQYYVHAPCPGEAFLWTPKRYTNKVPFDFIFKQAMNLKAGDIVYLYLTGTGGGTRAPKPGYVNAIKFYTTFYSTVVDVIKLP